MVRRKVIEYMILIPHRNSFFLSWCMRIQNNNIGAVTSQHYKWHPISNKLCCRNCWYYYLMYKSPLIEDIYLLFHRKKDNPLLLPFLSRLTPRTLTNLRSLATVLRNPDLYNILPFHVPKLKSIVRCVHHSKKNLSRSEAGYSVS
jgi:hypothetical protein